MIAKHSAPGDYNYFPAEIINRRFDFSFLKSRRWRVRWNNTTDRCSDSRGISNSLSLFTWILIRWIQQNLFIECNCQPANISTHFPDVSRADARAWSKSVFFFGKLVINSILLKFLSFSGQHSYAIFNWQYSCNYGY